MSATAAAIARLGGGAQVRVGTVTASAGGHITVNLGGTQVPNMTYLTTYTPAVNDNVLVIGDGRVWVVLGLTTS